MDSRRTGISNRAIAAIIAGFLLLIAAGLALSVRSSADRAWAAMQRRTRELIAEAQARPSARPVLRGTPEPGNAWTDYDAAAKLMESLRPESMSVYDYLTRKPKAERAAIEKLVAANGNIVELMRRGTRRSDGAFPYAWDRGISIDGPPLIRLQELGMLAAAHARLLREAGRVREAAEALLDVAQCGGDLRRNAVLISDLIGLAVISIAIDELRELQAASALATEDLAAIDRELEILDRSWADFAITLRNESMTAQTTLLASDSEWPGRVPKFFSTWRYGFSRKLMRANAGAEIAEYMELFIRQESMAWPDRVKAGKASEMEFTGFANPLAKSYSPGGLSLSSSVRQRRAQLRMLRVAIRFRLDGTVIQLDDPYGDQLRTVRSGAGLKVWSRGRDGIDQGGTGEWTRNATGTDIVLEVSK